MRGSHARLWLGGLAAGVLLVALLAPGAGAHAAYKYSDPDNKSSVSAPPSSVWAEFTEPPAPSSYLRVYDPCGRRVDNDDSQSTGYRVTVSMDGSAAGLYRVDWAVLSTLDGHPTSGTFTFTASSGDACPGAPEGDEPNESEGARGGDGGDSNPEAETGDGSDDEVSAATVENDGTGTRSGKGKKGPERRGDRRGDSESERGAGDPTALAQAQNQEPPPRSDEMPMDGLVTGLVLAALIGAAGGYIYAGIIGPKR